MTEQNEQPNQATPEGSETKTPLMGFLEHQVTAAQETMKAFEALIPPDFRTHSRAARREFLLSFKVLLDGAMTTVERELNKARNTSNPEKPASPTGSNGPSTTGKSKVKVEVS